MKLKTIASAVLIAGCMIGFTACSSEEKATEGDAEITKTVEKNENPAAKTQREQVQGSGGNAPTTLEPPPPDGN